MQANPSTPSTEILLRLPAVIAKAGKNCLIFAVNETGNPAKCTPV
jgi:hypothetical protein